jgi:hypothetical protein
MIRSTLLGLILIFSSLAWGQEWGATVGVHQTTADSNVTGASVDGKLNYRIGALLAFELGEGTKFRTGALYNTRHMDVTLPTGKYEYKFAYLDVPANIQYNFNEMVGVFGGMVIALNVGDDVDGPAGVTVRDPDAESMIAILNLGVNLTFNDMIGFDFYYERGMGRFADGLENHSTFGGSFLYWF